MIDWTNGFVEKPRWRELAPDTLSVPFLTPELCAQIVAHGELKGADAFAPYASDVKRNAAPGQECRLHLFDPAGQAPWKAAVERILYPIMRRYFWPLSFGPMRMPFVIRYDPAVQASLDPHHDASQLTINIPLTNEEHGIEGGVLHFPRQGIEIGPEAPVGHAVLFPGRVTHVHHVTPVTAGVRYSLVQWLATTAEKPEDVL